MVTLAPSPIPTTLIIDFYDSYTRNLLALFSKLGQLKSTTGSDGTEFTWEGQGLQERVVVVNVDSLTWESFTNDILPFISCVILGPGPGSPHKTEDFSWPTRLIKEFGAVLPILGVCLGHQGLATTFGGSVIKAPAPRHGQSSSIRHSQDALFNGIPNGFSAIQFNSLVVKTSDLPKELEAIAWAKNLDEENIMALRHRSQPLWGVQFHPESISSTYGATLLSNFLQLVKAHHSSINSPINTAHSLPLRIQALTTSYRRGASSTIPDVPTCDPAFASEEFSWEQRTVVVQSGNQTRSPQDVFEQFVKDTNPLGEIWLDSARPTVTPQFSHLCTPSFTWSYSQMTNDITIRTPTSSPASIQHLTMPNTFLNTLGTAQAELKRHTKIIESELPTVPLGFIGYIAYEMKASTLPHCEIVRCPSEPDRTDSEFAFASTVLSYEHDTDIWRYTGLVRVANSFGGSLGGDFQSFGVSEAEWKDSVGKALAYFATSPTVSTSPTLPDSIPLSSLVPDQLPTAYKASIEAARTHIKAGSAYELCLTTQFRHTLPTSLATAPYALYKSLRQRNPAPYAAYFHLPASSLALLSSSPERYMKIDKQGHAEMKPIKGTVRRCLDDPIEDERRRKGLEADEKERAENLMIVDLCRNDLLSFCEVESVQVPRLMVVETYASVHQLVTSIVGTLSAVVNPFEAISRAFPPGSMTGAPKLRSVKLLEELEGNIPRGPYAGIFGYVAVDGTADFAVVIRTLVIKGDELSMGAGGAITHLSNADNEWDEAIIKAEAVLGSK